MPFDEDQYQWEEVPSGDQKPKKQLPAWIKWAGIGFISLILVIGLVFLVKGMMNRFAQDEKIEEMVVQVSRAEAECLNAQDTEKCISAVAFRLASDHGDSDYCVDISDTVERDECFLTASIVSLDADGCAEVDDIALRTQCEDAILAQTIDDGYGIEACAGFSDEDDRSNCESSYILDAMLMDDCIDRGVDQGICDYGQIIVTAVANQNPDLCDDISDEEYYGTCLEMITVVDRDQDGLTEDQENRYGTDDRNPDTDGDGFTDKQEIDSGYDPLS